MFNLTCLAHRAYDARDEAFHARMEDQHDSFVMPVRKPNALGYRLIGLWRFYVTEPIRLIRQYRCKHPNMVHTGYGGPDSGCDSGECPDCGLSYYHSMY